jgi:hypothetical protein
VNRAFAKSIFDGEDPVGKSSNGGTQRFQVVGLAGDARYRNLREPITPTAYIPLHSAATDIVAEATFLVRTANRNPLSLAPWLPQQVSYPRSEFRVTNLETQSEINRGADGS